MSSERVLFRRDVSAEEIQGRSCITMTHTPLRSLMVFSAGAAIVSEGGTVGNVSLSWGSPAELLYCLGSRNAHETRQWPPVSANSRQGQGHEWRGMLGRPMPGNHRQAR